ncbi:MAG: cell envelope integrity protein TolA [Idiomarina sp.]
MAETNKTSAKPASDSAVKTSGRQLAGAGVSSSIKVPLAISIGLHLFIGAIIFVSMEFTPDYDRPAMQVDISNMEDDLENEIVAAVTVDKAAVEQQAAQIREQQQQQRDAEQRRVAELERRAAEAQRQAEQERQRQQQLAAQTAQEQREAEQEAQRVRERREAEEAAAEQAAQRRAREEAAAEKAAQERREEEARRQREAQEQREREEEQRRKAEREAQMQRELAEEMAQRQRARSQQMQTEIQKYTALIQQTIQRNWNIDDSMRGKSCELTISVAPSGFVKSVNTGSGDDNVCRSARNAVLKANTLPVSEDPDIYAEMATIKLTVKPEL